MKLCFFFLLLILTFNLGLAQELNEEQANFIYTFKKSIKNKNIKKLATLISYPLKREYPLPNIKNVSDFYLKFNEIFDDSLIKIISNSSIKNWSKMGWRGFMLNQGILWLDYDGNLSAINYQSKLENKKKSNLLKKIETTSIKS